MELRFIPPELGSLDEMDAEVLACPIWSDARPAHGVAGLCDWRLTGRVSDLLRRGLITAKLGEVVMLPGKPRLSFDKILLFGAGPRHAFNEETFLVVIEQMLATMEGLSARAAVVELPGRYDNLLKPERAADILLSCAGLKHEHDVWTLVEDADGRQRMTQYIIEERRRVRRVL